MEEIAEKKLYVVAVGASAGGLESFTEFLQHAPENDQLTYVFIQHLSSDYKSVLAELLAKQTKMRVMEVVEGLTIKANCVYVSPPRKWIAIQNDAFHLTDKDPQDRSPNTTIDIFLHSLAKEYEDKAVAVILSGTGTDGSRGIEAVKAAGGLVIVQEPASAKFDGMPNSAIATGQADLVLPVSDISTEIARFVTEAPDEDHLQREINRETLIRIHKLVYQHTGCDFREYKQPTVLRRLSRRLAFLKLRTAGEYADYLVENPEEARHLCREMLIGVTRFFRDRDAFEALRQKVIIPLVESKKDHDTLKVWVAGCSTGEEAYSIAMTINEVLRVRNRILEVKIFASDLEPSYLEKASMGLYPQYIEKELSREMLSRYFTKNDGFYRISALIRKQIVFARHNVISDPPFIRNDLVSCRNLLIYMSSLLQKQVISKFRFSLNNDGYLFLGSSENIPTRTDGFMELERKWKMFRKIGRNQNTGQEMYAEATPRSPVDQAALRTDSGKLKDNNQSAFFDDLGIGGFYIDKQNNVHETFGLYKRYIEKNNDEIRINLLKILPENISVVMGNGIFKAHKHNETQVLRNLYVTDDTGIYSVEASVRPNATSTGLTMVTFHSILLNPPVNQGNGSTSNEVVKLQTELRETRFNLQEAIEELQSSNEELLSSNEELQSSNEELQSLNEELHTLNTEHQQRIKDLTELNDDLNNYFRGSDIGQIIIDRSKRIKKFNPAAAKMVNLIDNDVNRLLTDLTINFEYNNYDADIDEVLKANKFIEREVNLENGKSMLVRIHSYITTQDKIEGALLSFVDITGYKELYNIVNGVFEASQAGIVVLRWHANKQGGFEVVTGNHAAMELFGVTLGQKGIPLKDFSPFLQETLNRELMAVLNDGHPMNTEVQIGEKWLEAVAVRMPGGVALTLNDVTARKQSEKKLRQSYSDLFAAKEELKELNQHLEEKIMERTRELLRSEERFRLVTNATNDIVIDWTFNDNSLWASDNYYRVFGLDPNTPLTTRSQWLANIHPNDRERVKRSIHASINRGDGIWKEEYRYRSSDGTFKIISDRGFVTKDENGIPYRMLSSMMDITDLRSAEEDLRQSELRLRMALDVSGFASWEYVFDSQNFLYSDKLPSLLGLPPGEKVDLKKAQQQYHDGDKPFTQLLMEMGNQHQQDLEYQARIHWPDGSLHWIGSHGKVFTDEHGKPVRMIGITRDVTSEKNAALELEEKVRMRTLELSRKNEAMLRQKDFNEAIIEASANAISVIDKDLRFTTANHAFELTFGLLKEQVIGKKLWEIYKSTDQQLLKKALREALQGKTSGTISILQIGNNRQHFENYFTPLMHKSDVYGVLVTSHNVTNIISANERLHLLNTQLSRSNSDLEQFAYIASHDLQEPLRKIQTFISIINENRKDIERNAMFMDKISASAQRMSSLISNVLQYSRLSNKENAFMAVDLNKIIAQLLVDFELNIQEKHATINASALPTLQAIPHQMNQLFFNLISNALKFGNDKVEINITSKRMTQVDAKKYSELDQQLKYHKITVTDNGIGFEEEYSSKIFSFFYRLDNKGQYPGSGIGLAVCKKIVLNHKGLIFANSEPGKGSVFTILLPETQEP